MSFTKLIHLFGLTARTFLSDRKVLQLHGLVAQLVEQRTENPRVGSSILSQATNKHEGLKGVDTMFRPFPFPFIGLNSGLSPMKDSH